MCYNAAIMITQEELKEYLDYNPDTGIFVWKKKTHIRAPIVIGEVAGHLENDGYKRITLFGKRYFAHRLAWIYMKESIPDKMQIDHINRNRDDNRIENLRLATSTENKRNCKKTKVNKSGYKGVHFDSAKRLVRKWRAQIRIGNKQIIIGRYYTPEEAYAAYCEAAKKYHKEFACIE